MTLQYIADTLQQNTLSSFVIDDIDDVEVMNSIHFLKIKASSGLHNISAKYFKISNKVVSPVLAKLFNKCLQEENFSDTLKLGLPTFCFAIPGHLNTGASNLFKPRASLAHQKYCWAKQIKQLDFCPKIIVISKKKKKVLT